MTIIVAYPNAAAGRRLVETAAVYARRADSDLLIVHHAKLRDIDAGVDREVQHVRQARAELHDLADEVREQGVPCRVTVVTSPEENPADDLLARVVNEQAELLVMGIRSRSRVGKLLLGSTAQDLLLAAECPVLAVKIDQPPAHAAGQRADVATPEGP